LGLTNHLFAPWHSRLTQKKAADDKKAAEDKKAAAAQKQAAPPTAARAPAAAAAAGAAAAGGGAVGGYEDARAYVENMTTTCYAKGTGQGECGVLFNASREEMSEEMWIFPARSCSHALARFFFLILRRC
jgi:hypothetical protein